MMRRIFGWVFIGLGFVALLGNISAQYFFPSAPTGIQAADLGTVFGRFLSVAIFFVIGMVLLYSGRRNR